MNNLTDVRFGVRSLDLMPDALQVLEEATADFPEDLRVGREAAALDWLETRGHERRESLQNADEASMLALDAMVSGRVDHAVVVIRSGDVSAEVPPTPPDYLNPAHNALYDPDLRRGVLLGAVGLSGYGYTTQQGGVIHNNMLLAESAIGKSDNASTSGELGLHTEDIFFSDGDDGGISPDVLALLFFRNIEAVPTPVAVVDTATLDPALRELLMQPRYTTLTSTACSTEAPTDIRFPIIYGVQAEKIRFNVPLMLGEDALRLHGQEEMEAMREFAAILCRQSVELVMSSGDMPFLNNRKALHAKGLQTVFTAAGRNRWQRRLATVTSLDRVARYCDVTTPRVVDPQRLLSAAAASRAR